MEDRQNHPMPVRRRRRRRRRNYRPLILLLALVLAGLVIWGIVAALSGSDDPAPTEPPRTEPLTAPPTQAPTEPTAPPTEPPEPTPEDIVAAFAAENGLTLEDYPQKLIELLGRNPEAREFVLNYPLEYGKDHEIDISGHADDEGVPLFIQWDAQWGYRDYVGNIAGLSGCGPTCLAMVMYHFTRDPGMHPAYMMEFAESNRTYANENGATQWAFFTKGAVELGLTVKELTSEQIASESKIADVLADGKVIVANVGPGVFTEIGHYLLVVGYEDGKFRVNDPNSPANSARLWDFEEFGDQIKMMWAFSM